MYDVIIVGAGPAGIFAAYELVTKKPSLKICLIEKGKKVKERTRKEVMHGVGGAGTFSDGKLHCTPVLSHEKMLNLWSKEEYQEVYSILIVIAITIIIITITTIITTVMVKR